MTITVVAAAEDHKSESREDSRELHERIDGAVDKILDENYSQAYELLSQSVDTAENPKIDDDYRDNTLLMNYLETDIADELSMAAHEEPTYGRNLEEIERDLQEFAESYSETED